MTCGYCGTSNPEEEHRCLRCGRRLAGFAPARGQGSALPAPAQDAAPLAAVPKRDAPAPRPPHQQTLFRVIPIESIARPRPEEETRRQPKETGRRLPHPDQPRLDFAAPAGAPAAAAPAPKPMVQCEARVASLRSRSEAVALDSLMVLLAGALFFGIFAGWTRTLSFSRTAPLIYASALTLILLFYRLLSCLMADRSPGARIAGFHLLHFDGRPATRKQRLLRLAASSLSLAPLGIGFFWALVDEEHLTFHDHISETFPTPDQPAR